jgi:hypothetical protein
MTVRFAFSCLAAAAGFAVSAAPGLAQQTLAPAQMVSPKILVARIDTNCAVFRNAIASVPATDVVRRSTSIWKLTSDGDLAVAEKTGGTVSYAKVWKQDGKYVWAHVVTHAAGGNARATQLCFRSDGTLARVRQATTVAGLDAVSARQAYYNVDGSLIRKSTAFVVDDPAIYKAVRSLPFFKILP